MDIKFVENDPLINHPRNPRTMTEKFMARYPRIAPTKERANILLLCVAIFFFILSIVIVIGYNIRMSGGF